MEETIEKIKVILTEKNVICKKDREQYILLLNISILDDFFT